MRALQSERAQRELSGLVAAGIFILFLAFIGVNARLQALHADTNAKLAWTERVNGHTAERQAKRYARVLAACLNGLAISASPNSFVLCDPIQISGGGK